MRIELSVKQNENKCCDCAQEFFNNQDIIIFEGDYFCDTDCLNSFIFSNTYEAIVVLKKEDAE